MANNPYTNKVVLADGRTLIDLTEDTVSADRMLSGTTAHDRSGQTITGTLLGVGSIWATDENVNPASVLGFGTWESIRRGMVTWGDVSGFTWAEMKQDTWGLDEHKKYIYVWIRTA